MSSPDASEKPDDDVTDNTTSSSGGGGLKENFSQQQAKITALKELVRQTEATQGKRTASAQEKAKNIAQRLTHLKSKSARAKHGDKSLTEVHEDETTAALQTFHHAATTSTSTTIASEADDVSITTSTTTIDNTTHDQPPAAQFQRADSLPAGGATVGARRPETPGSEKIALLRRQMEQNRARMAEREHSKRDIEQLVTQLKAKFNSSQMSLDRSTSVSSGHLGRSIGDLSLEHTSTAHASTRTRHHHRPADRFQSSADLSGVSNATSATITAPPHNFDRERIQYLEQRCAALEAEAAQREAAFVGRNVPAEQALRVRELDAEIIDLREQLREKDSVIEARTQAVGVVSEMGRTAEDELEDTRTEWQQSQRRFADAEQEFGEQLAAQAERIRGLEQANEILETARFELTVQRAQMEGGDGDFSTRLGELQRLNETLQRRIGELEAEKEVEEVESSGTAELETMVTELTRRVEELTANVQRLQGENDELKGAAEARERDDDGGDLGERLRTALATIERLDGDLQEKFTECNVLSANCAVLQEKLKAATPKSLFSVHDDQSEAADSAEASTTDTGANSSGECARLKQQLDEANKAAIKTKLKTRQLQKQIDTLRKADATARQVGELTDACDALRQRVLELEELAAATAVPAAAPESSTAAADRVQVLEATCHNQIEAIRLLEEQKCELSEDLSGARAELGELRERTRDADESERHAQVTSELAACRQEEDLDAVRATVGELRTQIAAGQAERSVLAERLNHYVAENMELLDRWEKVGNGSSAESIEIVENLTASERLEMEAIEHQQQQATSTEAAATGLVDGQEEHEEAAGETDSSAMSQDLSDSLVRLREESSELMERIEAFTSERREVLGKMELLQADNAGLLGEVEELRRVVQELQAVQTAPPAPEVLPPSPAVEFSGELYEKSLRALEALLEGYRRGKDKNAKFDVSKKLAKEAKNNVELVQRLLGEHVELVGRVNRLQQEIAVARNEERVGGGEVETVRALEKQVATAQQTIEELETSRSAATREINELSKEVDRLQSVAQKTAELDAENTIAQKTIDQLESDRAASTLEIAELRTELNRLQSAEQNAATERTELADELAAVRADLQRTERATAVAVDGQRSAEQEREILKKLVAEQKDQLIDTITEFQQTVDEQCAEIDELRAQKSKEQGHEQGVVAELNDKMIALKRLFDENNAQLERQAAELVEKRETVDTLNAQLMEVYGSGEDAAAQLAAKDDELFYVQEICEANRAEATALCAKLAASEAAGRRLEETIAEQVHAIRVLEDKAKAAAATAAAAEVKPSVEASADAATLRTQVAELEARNREQLDKLKKFAANLKKKNAQCAELGEKIAALEAKETGDAGRLEAELVEKTNAMRELSTEIERLQAASVDSNKYAELSETLARQTDELRQLEREKHELSSANAEIANENSRNLVTMIEQNDQLLQLDERLQRSAAELDERLQRSTAELDAMRVEHGTQAGELHELRVKIEKCKQIIREKNRELKRLQEHVAELQSAPALAPDDSVAAELATERQLRSADALKLSEHEHFIESLHAERAQLEAHIAQLEERLGQAAEHAAETAAERATRAEELRTLTERFDEAVRQHGVELQQQTANAEHALQRSAAAEAAEADLVNSLAEAREDLATCTERANRAAARADTLDAQLHGLAEENARLATETAHLQDAVRRAQSDNAAQLAAKHAEIDTLENELSAQLQAIDGERRRLQDDCDRERDANAELAAEAVRLKECITSLELSSGELERDAGWLRMQNEGMQQDQVEVQELRMQIVHDQTELENAQAHGRDLVAAHETEVAALRQQLAELDSLRTQIGQNQTDDQMCIQNENERLQARLVAMEAEVVEYQRQNLQLQMAGGGGASEAGGGVAALFAVTPPAEVLPVVAEVATESPSSDSEKLLQSERISVDLQARLEHAENELQAVQARLTASKLEAEMNAAFSADVADGARMELVSLRRQIEEAQSTDRDKEEQLRELREVIERIQGGEASVEPVVVVRQQQVSAAGAPAALAAPDEGAETALQRRNVAHLEEYINDLQIQLRIATNDCEQLAHTQHSLEEEIQQRSRGYEQQIDELRGQMLEQRQQQQQRQEQAQPIDESVLSSIESQIIPQPAASTSTAAVPSFDGAMFFGHTTPGTSAALFDSFASPPSIAATSAAVASSVEPTIVPKTAYVCHDGGDADDGWGFGADEAALEEQHQQQQQQPSAAVQLRTLQCQLAEVQTEQERLRADNAAMQQKSAKMLRKLKEYKARNDELTEAAAAAQHAQRAGSAGSSDLDLAIQEELHSQIRSLEARLKEVRTEQDSSQLERTSLLKRVDVLTSANERMTEMKERQDVDMEACRLRLRQVQQQLDQMHQWQDHDDDGGAQVDAAKPSAQLVSTAGDVAAAVAVISNEPQLAELRRQCADLQTDNAELQAILDAEKELTASLEERLQRAGSSAASAADDSLRAANEQQQQLTAQVAQLSARLAESVATIDTLSADSGTIRVHLDALRAEHQLKIEENSTLAQQFRAMADQLGAMKSSLLDGREAAQLEEQCEQMRATLQCREAEVDHLNGQLAAANGGRALVEQELAARCEEIGALRQQVGELRQQIGELQQQQRDAEQLKNVESAVEPTPSAAPQVEDHSAELHARIAQLGGELAALHDEKRSMEHELAVLNDQVINSLNLEDDMRAQRLQMDAKTIEIAELKGSLARLAQQQQQQHESQTAHATTAGELEAHSKQLNAHWEQVLEERCTALAESWRQHMAAREDEFAAQLARHPHVDETTQTSTTSSPAPSTVGSAANTPAKRSEDDGGLAADERTAIADMQQALETQELEIVTLKEQLAIRSAEYARLAAQVDPFGSGKMTATAAATQRREPNQKSELDLCLYMLHQRDMRCEELTEELMSMLEERDSLQMKLAGTMRQMERLRVVAQDGSGGEAPSEVDSAEITPEKPHHAHDTSTDQSSPAPTTRHKTLRDEREQRHRQMAILQRDVATLPVEAVAELMGADYAEAAAAAQHAAGANAAAEAAAAVAAADESPYTALMNLFWGPRAPAPNES